VRNDFLFIKYPCDFIFILHAGAKCNFPCIVVDSAGHSAMYKLTTFLTKLTLQDIIVR
jgi:hypothetical protein